MIAVCYLRHHLIKRLAPSRGDINIVKFHTWHYGNPTQSISRLVDISENPSTDLNSVPPMASQPEGAYETPGDA